jgi:hypothetical protein
MCRPTVSFLLFICEEDSGNRTLRTHLCRDLTVSSKLLDKVLSLLYFVKCLALSEYVSLSKLTLIVNVLLTCVHVFVLSLQFRVGKRLSSSYSKLCRFQ